MSDNSKVGWPTIWVGILSAAGGLVTLLATISYVLGTGAVTDKWQALAIIAGAVVIAFVVVAMFRFALAPLIAPRPSAAGVDADAAVRSRIGPMVLLIGIVAIVVLALVLMISFAVLAQYQAPLKDKVDTLIGGVFSTVLPVIATWVGTVLAFYFGSENFRQAAQSTREALSDRLAPKKKIGDPGVMVPYERSLACMQRTNPMPKQI